METEYTDQLEELENNYSNARRALIASMLDLTTMYRRLRQLVRSFNPSGLKEIRTSIKGHTLLTDMPNLQMDINDAWNCDIIQDEQADILSDLLTNFQDTLQEVINH